MFDSLVKGITGIFTGAVKPILDKFVGDKMNEADKKRMELEIEQAVSKAVERDKEMFYGFVLQHTGAAVDMPRSIQILRGSVRPVLTYAIVFFDGFFIWNWLNSGADRYDADAFSLVMKLLLSSTVLVLGFWFGERLLTRSGIAQAMLKRNGK